MLATIGILAAGLAVDGSTRVEGRGGSSVAGESPSAAAVFADVEGRLPHPDGVLGFSLSPSAVLAQTRQFFLRGAANADFRLERNTWARVRQTLGYGKVDTFPLGGAAVLDPAQRPPAARFLAYQESKTTVELDVTASRRLHYVGSASWVVTGGADAEARASVPLARGPEVRARADWAATRVDSLYVDASAFDASYSNGRRSSVARVTVGWSTHGSRSSEASIAAGPGFGREQAETGSVSTRVYASGTADWRAKLARDWSTALGASIEPVGDALTGEIVERLSGHGAVVWGLPSRTTVTLRAVMSVSLSSAGAGRAVEQAGDRFAHGELAANVPVGSRSSLTAGARAVFLSHPLSGESPTQWGAFVGWVAQLPLVR